MSSATAQRRPKPTEPSHTWERASFDLRCRCVVCQNETFDAVWSGSFDDAAVQAFLGQFHYAGEVGSALAGASFSLVQCRSCRMMYHQQVLTPEWLARLYGNWIDSEQIERFEAQVNAGGLSAARFERGRQYCKHLLRLNRLLPRDKAAVRTILDFGCGDGDFLNMASAFGFEAYGVDFSVTRAERLKVRGVTVVASLQALDGLGSAPFNAIALFETLEHLVAPAALLTQLHERLKPGGILIAEVPDCSGLTVPQNLSEFHALQPLEHINAFTPSTLEALCTRCGFERILKPAAHVTTDVIDLARTLAGSLVHRASTQQYFRKR